MLHFLWRLGQNSLALWVNRKRRGIKLDTCAEGSMIAGIYLFFKCKTVCRLWNDLQLDHVRALMVYRSGG